MVNRWWAFAAIATAGCGDNGAGRELAQAPGILARTDPATPAECPYGGSVVRSGFDANHDGVLEDAEATTRTALCNDPPAQPSPMLVVRLLAEPAGAHCSLGGTAVQSGHDRNGNGRLDDDEVEHIDYVCGEVLLTRLAVEPPGARCVAGGVVFLVGRDRNHDGQLGDDEIEQTELECGDELTRDVAIQSAGDAAALANIAVIGGSLMVDGTALGELALPQLVQVHGALQISNDDALTRVAMPALQWVGGPLTLARDRQLATVDMARLQRAGSLIIDGTGELQDLSGFSALTDVDHDVRISDNGNLGSAVVDIFRLGGGLAVEGNAQLATLTLDLFGSPGQVRIASNPRLTSLELPSPDVGLLNSIGETTIESNAQLAHVTLRAAAVAAITITDNPALADVTAAGRISGDVQVRGNGPLSVALPAVIGGSVTLSGPITAFGGPSSVGGDLTFDATGLSSLTSPNQFIEAAGTLHIINNPQLVTASRVDFGRGLEVRNNSALTTLTVFVDTPTGDEVEGSVTITDNPVLQTAPGLDPVIRIRGDVNIARNPALTGAFSDSLVLVTGDLIFDGNDSLAAPGLAHLMHAASLEVARCPAILELDLLALSDVTSGIDVRNNAGLLHLRLPALHQADMGVFDNPHLPECEVEALFAAMLGDHHESGNDGTAVCGP
jgi:hypothetical protein